MSNIKTNPFYFAMLDVDEERRKLISLENGIDKYFSYLIAVTGYNRAEIVKKTRKREIVERRQHIMYLLRGLGNPLKEEHEYFNALRDSLGMYYFSAAKIGAFIGQKDHATVHHSVKKVLMMKDAYPSYKNFIEKLERIILEFHIEQVEKERKRERVQQSLSVDERGVLYLKQISNIISEANNDLPHISTKEYTLLARIKRQLLEYEERGHGKLFY